MFQDLSDGTLKLSKIKQQVILNLKLQKKICTMAPTPPDKHFDPISTPWKKGDFTIWRTVIARGWWRHGAIFFLPFEKLFWFCNVFPLHISVGHSVHDTLLITNSIMDKDACISITMGSYTTIKGTSIMEDP